MKYSNIEMSRHYTKRQGEEEYLDLQCEIPGRKQDRNKKE